MATIIQKKNKSIEIRYTDCAGTLRSLYPGKIAKRAAESIGTKIDHIVSRQIVGADPDRDVSQWLADLPEKLFAKLVKHRLAQPRVTLPARPTADTPTSPTIREWTDRYIREHSGKDGTIEQLEITARSLCKKFGEGKRLDTFTAGDAEGFRKWLETKGNERKKYRTGLATGTVRRRVGRAKQFFNAAIKHELIGKNPFAGEQSATVANPDRLVMVPADSIEACIRVAPCEDWRIILAFARYAGMRSHETRIQKWEDIDLVNNFMLVRSHKTPPIRRCPIFPELRPHLLRAREMAADGATYVQTRYTHDANILTTLEKIIARAGLVPWEKPMQNLRATRETELLAHYPAKDVTSWLGNSPEVANKHYVMTMQASFDRAVKEGAKIAGVTAKTLAKQTPTTASERGVGVHLKTPQNPPQTMQDSGRHSETKKKPNHENPVNNWECLVSALADLPLSYPARTRT